MPTTRDGGVASAARRKPASAIALLKRRDAGKVDGSIRDVVFTANDIFTESEAALLARKPRVAGMLRDLHRRVQQDEKEALRDPRTDPRPGDRVQLADGDAIVFTDREAKKHELEAWGRWCMKPGATVVRRREAQP